MKDTFYFQHDYSPMSDIKMQAFIGEHGAIGYGLFWRIVEMLHEEDTHKLCHKQYVFIGLAKQMSTSVEQVQLVVEQCINVFELFASDGVYFWSERVMRNIEKRNSLSEKRSSAGKKSAESRKKLTSVEQVSASVEQIPTKERKEKEIKEKEIKDKKEKFPAPPFLTENFISVWNGFLQTPKQKKKSVSAIELMSKKLSKYDEVFAIKLIETAIMNNYQGVVFDDTDEKYEKYIKSKASAPKPIELDQYGRPKTNVHGIPLHLIK